MHDSRFLARTTTVVVLTMLTVLSIFSGAAFAQLNVTTDQNRIKINAFYHGSHIKISGDTDLATDLVIKITSPEGESQLREKGKVGPFWLNTEKLRFEHVPNLYLQYSTREIKDILSQDEADKYVIGYPAMEKHTRLVPLKKDSEKTKWFNEFVKFKEAAGVYQISPERISLNKNRAESLYSITVDWPYQAQPGKYLVTVYEVDHNKVIGKTEASISVKQDGIVKTIGDLASKNGALYGVLSIVIALVVGFGISLIFKKS